MNDVLPGGRDRDEPGLPVSGTAVLGGVLTAYGAFAVLISIVAAFANGAHSHQVLSGATWKQLGTGGGIVAGIVLFVAWAAGGFVAARMAGRDGVRHGVWVFVVGVVLITVVGAAITWLPDTTAILRNLRLLGLPLRRNEWRDVATVGGVASLVGMAAGAPAGGWLAGRTRSAVPAAVRTAAPVAPAAPPPAPPLPPKPAMKAEAPEPGPVAVEQPLFSQADFEPEPEERRPAEREGEPVAEEAPAWLQFVEERERAIHERGSAHDEPVPAPSPEPAPWAGDEPAPTFIEEPEEQEPEAASAGSWWPEQGEQSRSAEPEVRPAPAFDDAWALPDDEAAPAGPDGPESAAFPHPPPMPVPEQDTEVVVPPLAEHANWHEDEDDDLYRAPPQLADDELLQGAPAAPAPEESVEEREERRRQQEEAARAYEQARRNGPLALDLRALEYAVDDGVAVLTLNRPDRLNAWTARMEYEYAWALTRADADADVRVVVLTGAGRGFCAGADVKALDRISAAGDYDEATPPRPDDVPDLATGEVHLLPSRMRKPVIAAVNGPAAGVGFVLMCSADIRFAAEGAKVTTSFARLGLPAEHGVSWILVRLVGPGRAADLLLSSRVVLAEEAAAMGLVNAVLPPQELLPHTMAYAKRMAAELSPASLAVIKRQIYDDLQRDQGAALEWSVDEMKRMVKEPDFAEGAAALGDRRPPRFGPLS